MTICVEKRNVAKLPKFWHVGFLSAENALRFCFRWVALSFRELTYAKRAHRLERLSVFLRAQYLENEGSVKCTNYGTLHNIPKQNCELILELFRQSLLLMKILMPLSAKVNEAGPLL